MQSPPNRAVTNGFGYTAFYFDHTLMESTDLKRIDTALETFIRQDPEGNKEYIDRLRKHREDVAK